MKLILTPIKNYWLRRVMFSVSTRESLFRRIEIGTFEKEDGTTEWYVFIRLVKDKSLLCQKHYEGVFSSKKKALEHIAKVVHDICKETGIIK